MQINICAFLYCQTSAIPTTRMANLTGRNDTLHDDKLDGSTGSSAATGHFAIGADPKHQHEPDEEEQ